MNYSTVLNEIITHLNSSNSDELAYLALTSKSENPLRDKIAFELHKKYYATKMICREWKGNGTNKRADLAILNKGTKQPVCIIEFKAPSAISGINQWVRALKSDFLKNELYNCEVIFVLFVNFISEFSFNDNQKEAVKYFERIKKAVMSKKYSKQQLVENWKKKLLENEITCKELNVATISAGKYENQPVEIFAFIHSGINIK